MRSPWVKSRVIYTSPTSPQPQLERSNFWTYHIKTKLICEKYKVYISNIHQPGGIVMYEAYCKTLLYQVVTGCSPGDDYKFGGYNCDETTGKVELKVQLADLRLPS